MTPNPYFKKFETNGFKHDDAVHFEDEFDRLAKSMGWLTLGKAYNRHHAKAQALEQNQGGARLPTPPQDHSYMSKFAANGFIPNLNASFKNDFSRLAVLMDWSVDSLEYERQRLVAIQDEFDRNYGSASKLQGWQELCRDVGIVAIPVSIKQCRKELAKVYINLCDFVDWRRKPEPRKPFDKQMGSLNALRKYTKRTGKVFPKVLAKEEGFIKALLRRIF